MGKLILAAFAVAVTAAVASPANAGGTGWSCRTCGFSNGTQITGVTPEPRKDIAPLVISVILPSGEIVQTAEARLPRPRPTPKPIEDKGKDLESQDKMQNFEIQQLS